MKEKGWIFFLQLICNRRSVGENMVGCVRRPKEGGKKKSKMKGKAGKGISLLDKLHTNVAEWRLLCNIQKKKNTVESDDDGFEGIKSEFW